MKIVIDIPKEMYQNALSDRLCGSVTLVNAIKNGTPLPRGCSRLIDIGKYEKEYFNVAIQYDDGNHIHSVYTSTILSIIESESEDNR